jgi:hypothetical protein
VGENSIVRALLRLPGWCCIGMVPTLLLLLLGLPPQRSGEVPAWPVVR